MTGNTTSPAATLGEPAAQVPHLLPEALLSLAIDQLPVAEPLLASLRAQGLGTLGDLLALPAAVFLPGAWLGPSGAEELRLAIGRALHAGLGQLAPCPGDPSADWQTLHGQLLAPLDEEQARMLCALVGLGTTACTLPEYARQRRCTLAAAEAAADQVRHCLHERAGKLLGQLRQELGRELQAFDGIVDSEHLALGTAMHTIAVGSNDPLAPFRLLAFCFPHDCHLHGAKLAGLSPRRFRRLLRTLRRLATPNRLPLPVDTLLAELAAEQADGPRGLVLHLLRTEARVAIELGEAGETAVPDPRSPTARLQDLLAEHGQPMQLEDLVFAYRERFRRASPAAVEQRLRADPAFVMLGPCTWTLRRWHEQELAAVAPLVDKVARRLCTEGGRQNVAVLLVEDRPDDRTIWLVLDGLGRDPRVRLLGRGDLCPATHTRSQVLEQLLLDFRRAAGEVVESLFLENQPPSRRRLVQRLLRENRLFVIPAEDRVDTLTNYPFNEERLRRLLTLVQQQLAQRTGYAHSSALKAALDRTDLGGAWLTTTLLTDLLRRHGSFEVLPGGLIGRRDLGLGQRLMRLVRQALREAGEPVSVEEILRARPDLVEFTVCLHDLLRSDPMVQTPDGDHFTLV